MQNILYYIFTFFYLVSSYSKCRFFLGWYVTAVSKFRIKLGNCVVLLSADSHNNERCVWVGSHACAYIVTQFTSSYLYPFFEQSVWNYHIKWRSYTATYICVIFSSGGIIVKYRFRLLCPSVCMSVCLSVCDHMSEWIHLLVESTTHL